jgi:hypothetical protein
MRRSIISWLRWIVEYLFDCVLVEEIDIRLFGR